MEKSWGFTPPLGSVGLFALSGRQGGGQSLIGPRASL